MIVKSQIKHGITNLYNSKESTQKELALKFDLAQSTISNIIQDFKLKSKLSIALNQTEKFSIEDDAKRLIESVKLAKKLNILTERFVLKIARVSHYTLVKHFGSFLGLLVNSGVYQGNCNKLPWPDIKFSNYDILRNIKIPDETTKSVGEFAGIHAGDGSCYLSHDYTKNTAGYCTRVSGHPIDEKAVLWWNCCTALLKIIQSFYSPNFS